MISIIVTAYNNTLYIKEALDSIIESCEDIEYELLIGIDTCQKTLEYVKSIRNKLTTNTKIFFFTKKPGTYVIRNTLASISKYDKLLFFDSDDVMRNELVGKVINSLDNNDYSSYGYLLFNGDLTFPKKGIVPNTSIKFAPGTFGMNKQKFMDFNGFEPWICASDGEFYWRVISNKLKIEVLNIVGFYHRRHSTNLTTVNETGMNSPLRKQYHKKKEEKQKNNQINPLSKLEISDFIEINDNTPNGLEIYYNEKQNTKELSIIIPTFNSEFFLQNCLDSIINSIKNLDCEILVGIDGCEKTLNYIKNKKFDYRIKFFYFDKNSGPYVVKNTLCKISNSENIIFFDSDDIMKENMVSLILSKLSGNDFVKPMYCDFTDGKKITEVSKTNNYGEGVFAIRRKLFLEMNGFEPWRCAADSDFMGRLYKNNKKFSFTDEVVFYRRIHPNSLTQNPETCAWSKLRAHYYNLSKNRKTFGPLPTFSTESFVEIHTDKLIFSDKNVFEEVIDKKNSIMNKVMFNIKPREEKKIDYDQINQVVQQKGVYTPTKNIPIRENKPNDRNELQKLKNGQNNQQLEKLFKVKPNRRNGLPNIF